MKTKNLFRLGFLLLAAMTLSFTSCKKDKTTEHNPTPTPTEPMQQLTQDENNVENSTDQALNDVNTELTPSKLKSTENGGPCNADVHIGGVVNDTITVTITYNGLNCNGSHFRTGQVILKKRFDEDWGLPGATVLVFLNNFKTTKVSNGKSLTLNGTKHYENVSGHYLWQLGLDSTVTAVVDRVWGSVTATFDDNTQRVWNIARQRTFTGSLINLNMTTDGFGSADGYTNLATWGTARNGDLFYSTISQSVVHKQHCSWNPCSGVIKHEIPAASKSVTATFGYDSNYQLITNGDCPTYYKLDWVVGPNSGTIFLPL